MNQKNKFICDMCGECCRHVDQVTELAYLDSGNGICINLEGNRCSIYESRPDICNIEKMYENRFKGVMSLEEYYQLNYEGCRHLKELYLKPQ